MPRQVEGALDSNVRCRAAFDETCLLLGDSMRRIAIISDRLTTTAPARAA